MAHPVAAIEVARFYPEVPGLFWRNQEREAPAYEDVIYRAAAHPTSADIERALRFVGSSSKVQAREAAEALDRVLGQVEYPGAQALLELKGTGLNLPEAVAALHFFRPAWPLYRPPTVEALRALGFAVEWRAELTEDGVGAYEGYIAAIDLLKRRIPYDYVPETNVFLSRLIEAALTARAVK